MHVPANIKARVDATLRSCIKAAEAHYNITVKFPTVLYTKRGTTAGTANYVRYEVNFNSVLLTENIEDFIARTVPHEMAHLVDHQLHPENFESTVRMTRTGRWKRTKRDVHGRTFRAIMDVFGADDSTRTHNYDTTNARVKKTTGAKHVYVCQTCATEMKLGPTRHAKMSAGRSRYWMRGCGRHAGYTYVGLEARRPQVAEAAQASKPAPATPLPHRSKSKLELCREWYNSSLSRAQNIANFVNEVCCTPAGASSYYSKIKSER